METPKYRIIFSAQGHTNITALHKSTIELTKESYLTKRGSCIIGVNSQLCCADLPNEIKNRLRDAAKVIIKLRVGNIEDNIKCRGDRNLTLKSHVSIVIRKSEYIDDRTMAVGADKAARDINRKLIKELKKEHRITVTIEVY